MGANGHNARQLALVFFFVSGATALAFEVLWIKRYAQLWGSTALALGVVLACYLGGLGIGAAVGGRWAPRARRPLRWYAGCELGVALLALAVPWQQAWLAELAAPVLRAALDRPLATSALQVALTALVLVPPTFLMGATMPFLVRHLEALGVALGRSSAGLYAANSVGAATGAMATGFLLLPALGIGATNLAACAVNVALAIAAFGFGRTALPVAEKAAPERAWTVWAVVPPLLCGAGALTLQVVWSRQLVLALGGSTYAWSALVAVFVGGLGLGGALYRAVAARRAFDSTRLVVALLVIVVATLVSFPVAPWICDLAGSWRAARTGHVTNALVCGSLSFLLQGPATLAMGFAFPALIELVRRRTASAEGAVGLVLASNTFGSVVAALVTAPILIPALGLRWTAVAAIACYAGTLLCVARLEEGRASRRGLHACLAAVLLAILFPIAWRPAPIATNLGRFLYGDEVLALFEEDTAPEVVFFREGASANVLVLEQRVDGGTVRSLLINGKVDGGSGRTDQMTQRGLGVLPRLLRPDARRVLVIGYGTGMTAGVSLLFPGTAVDCVELEDAVVEAGARFADVNHRPEESPDYRLIRGDGRVFVQLTDARYDLIVSEPTNPWISGVGNLFTREFFARSAEVLSSDGVLAQWIPVYSLAREDLALVLRTVRSAFPHVLLLSTDSTDALMLASRSPLDPDDGLERAQALFDATPALAEAVREQYGTTSAKAILFASLVMDANGIDAVAASDGASDLNTDANLRLEFDTPRVAFAGYAEASGESLRVDRMVDTRVHRRLATGWGLDDDTRAAFRAACARYAAGDAPGVAAQLSLLATSLYPEDDELLALAILHGGATQNRSLADAVRSLTARDFDLSIELARDFLRRGDVPSAELVANDLARLHPERRGEIQRLLAGPE